MTYRDLIKGQTNPEAPTMPPGGGPTKEEWANFAEWMDCAVDDLVARTRYRVFGRLDRCLVPRPEVRSRFIE